MIANIAVNADIARDHTEIGKAKPSETHANVGGVGMTAHKPFGILVELWGEGRNRGGTDRAVAEHRG